MSKPKLRTDEIRGHFKQNHLGLSDMDFTDSTTSIPASPSGGNSIVKFINCDFNELTFDQRPSAFVEIELIGCTFNKLTLPTHLRFFNSPIPIKINDCKVKSLEFQVDIGFNIEGGTIETLRLNGNQNQSTISSLKDKIERVEGVITNLVLKGLKIEIIEAIIMHLSISNSTSIDKILTKNENSTVIISDSMVNDVGGKYNHLEIRGSQITSLKPIQLNALLTNKSGKRSTEIKTLDLTGVTNKTVGNLNLIDTKVTDLILKDLNILTVKFLRVAIEETFEFENGVINNASNSEFINVDFTKSSLRFLNSSLGDRTKLLNVRWKRDYKLHDYALERKVNPSESINILWSLKEVYRQVKVLSLDQHNKIDAMYFHKHEVRCYYQIIELQLRNQFTFGHFFDWLVLVTNRICSDFGLSWFRPLLVWFLIHGVLLIFLLKNFNLGVEFSLSSSTTLAATIKGSKIFLELLFPIHSREFPNVYTGKAVPIWGYLDFAMRIIAPYFIYYFIKGTRKFNVGL